MEINCPRGCKVTMRTDQTIFVDQRVNIFDGICDAPDLCAIEDCEFYDLSPEAHHRYLHAQARSQASIEAIFEERRLKEIWQRERRYAGKHNIRRADEPPALDKESTLTALDHDKPGIEKDILEPESVADLIDPADERGRWN